MEEALCVVEIVRLHSNAAGLSARAVRYLKVEIEPDRFFWDRLIIAAHLVSPRFAWRILGCDFDFRAARLWQAWCLKAAAPGGLELNPEAPILTGLSTVIHDVAKPRLLRGSTILSASISAKLSGGVQNGVLAALLDSSAAN